MVDAGLLAGPPVPWFGRFLEMNVRTYGVDASGRRGVVFLSLEAERALVAVAARALFNVPYYWAHMGFAESTHPDGRHVAAYETRRHGHGRRPPVSSRIRVAIGPSAEPDDLSLFLTARFGLHTRFAGRTLWVPNTHDAWPLRSAEVLELDDGLLDAAGFGDLARRPPDSVLFSSGLRTVFGFPRRVEA